MNKTFEDVVELVRDLPLDEKEEMKFIIEKSIVEERREEFYKNYQESKKEQEKGHLVFSNSIEDLKKVLG